MNSKQRKEKLKKLSAKAQKYHLKVRTTLEAAFRCGQALLEAKFLVKHRQWQKWLKKNVPEISYPVAAEYMRIARNWDKPALKKAREEGNVFTSIRSVLNFSAKKQVKDELQAKPLTEKQMKAAKIREQLKETFGYYLLSLRYDELFMFNNIFNPLETALWERVVDKLHELVCCKLECDPYEYELSFNNKCPLLNEKNVDEYLEYAKTHPQYGNNFFDRGRKYQIDQLTSEIANLKIWMVLNKKAVSSKKIKKVKSKLVKREKEFQKLRQFMEN